jgi:alanine dehydrogenase
MIVGLPKEIKNQESRAGLTPACAAAYAAAGNTVLFEKGAGAGAGFSDDEYIKAGARPLESAKEVWERAEMIVKVKEPVESEYRYLRENLLVYTYFHLAADKPLTGALLASKVKAVAYETITGADGGLPCLTPMSYIAGRMSVIEGAKYLQKTFGGRGVLLAGIPGVERGTVVVLGGGTAGTEAARMALGLGADVTVFDINFKRLAYLDDIFSGRIKTLASKTDRIAAAVVDADVVIGAVLIPGAKAPTLINKADLARMKKGSVLVDIAVDQGGCFETTRPTTHENPVFTEDGIVHYCVANMPGAVARTSTMALTNATLSGGLELAGKGLGKAAAENVHLANGVNTYNGACTCKGVAEAFNLPYVPLGELI